MWDCPVSTDYGGENYIKFVYCFRLSWYIRGEPKNKQLYNINDMTHGELSTNQNYILRELQAYLQYWKTESQREKLFQTFFHIVDQLSFEIAVQGFIRKSDAVIIRDFMLDMVAVGYSIPELISNWHCYTFATFLKKYLTIRHGN